MEEEEEEDEERQQEDEISRIMCHFLFKIKRYPSFFPSLISSFLNLDFQISLDWQNFVHTLRSLSSRC